MQNMKRFAIYYAPPAGPLAEFAANWLGWDPATAEERPHPAISGLPLPVETLTATPRKYGFHGTIKPPFRLAHDATPGDLQAATAALAARLAPVSLPGLRLAKINGFLCLVPDGDTAPLCTLAAEGVRALDPLRAPLTIAEMNRRRPETLSHRQRDLLDQWGYPYVMEEFRFHLTLTGDLEPELADATATALAPHLEPLLPQPFTIADLCLFGEDAAGRFHLLHRYALSG